MKTKPTLATRSEWQSEIRNPKSERSPNTEGRSASREMPARLGVPPSASGPCGRTQASSALDAPPVEAGTPNAAHTPRAFRTSGFGFVWDFGFRISDLRPALLVLLLLATLISRLSSVAQSTAFTYQGRLRDSGTPATGICDLRFTIYDAASGGNQVGSTVTADDVALTNGLFNVVLDFGASVFSGDDRWLEIELRPGAETGAYSTLSPRRPIQAVPYAMQAATATTAGSLSGTLPASQLTGTLSTNNFAAGSITSTMLASGAVGSDQLADGAVTAGKMATALNWFLATTITNPTPATSDYFGYSVAAVGTDQVLIGAYRDDTGATDAGAAYLLRTDGTLLTTFTNPTPVADDNFGYSVAAVGTDRVLIGAYRDDTGADNAGAAYLFSTSGTLLTTFTNPTPVASDNFGISVSAVGT
ncbi:MAG TPA: FG-GAP repeat protein, partial [Verrucomicrobiae bacterium]